MAKQERIEVGRIVRVAVADGARGSCLVVTDGPPSKESPLYGLRSRFILELETPLSKALDRSIVGESPSLPKRGNSFEISSFFFSASANDPRPSCWVDERVRDPDDLQSEGRQVPPALNNGRNNQAQPSVK